MLTVNHIFSLSVVAIKAFARPNGYGRISRCFRDDKRLAKIWSVCSAKLCRKWRTGVRHSLKNVNLRNAHICACVCVYVCAFLYVENFPPQRLKDTDRALLFPLKKEWYGMIFFLSECSSPRFQRWGMFGVLVVEGWCRRVKRLLCDWAT